MANPNTSNTSDCTTEIDNIFSQCRPITDTELETLMKPIQFAVNAKEMSPEEAEQIEDYLKNFKVIQINSHTKTYIKG